MVYSIAEHIISPLGVGIEANLTALHEGRTALQRHNAVHGTTLVEPIYASLLPDNPQPTPRFPDSPIPRFTNPLDGYTLFESWCICCVQGALHHSINSSFLASPRTIFILSSTKGDIWTPNTETARHIAHFFGNTQSPIVVSLACTSGVSAQITAWRLLECGMYDTAVVIGCDVLTDFVAAGFQCVHATSMQPCRPFDKDREGLNLGEAVGCLILHHFPDSHNSKFKIHNSKFIIHNSKFIIHNSHPWQLLSGSIHNDANHISGPSRTAEGAYRCLQDMLSIIDKDDLACVSVHGTATLYNDEMESTALHRAGLDEVPVSALKGYYGHTMGAAGVVETILTMHALDKGIIPAVRGFEQQGTTYAANVSNQERTTDKTSFIKLLSGFGGVNAAVAWTKSPIVASEQQFAFGETTICAAEQQFAFGETTLNLTSAYKSLAIDYPKFYKMDTLSKVAFVAVEQLLQQVRQNQPDFTLDSERCVLIFANRYSSLSANRAFQKTIENKDDYFPSPALFVYTLPNVMMGEIAIRHHLFGETACYVLDKEEDLQPIVQSTLSTVHCALSTVNWTQAIVAWVECTDDEHFEAHVQLFNLS